MAAVAKSRWGINKYEKDSTLELLDEDGHGARVIEVTKLHNGKILFIDGCDGCFSVECNKDEAWQIVEELKAWLKEESRS